MSEEEIISMYVKERYPELLCTMDFVVYKMCVRLRNLQQEIRKGIEKWQEKIEK